MSEREFCISETQKHQDAVREIMNGIAVEMQVRATTHDNSKLGDIELEGFVEYTPKLRKCTYGSAEYKGYLESMKPFLEHHYQNNRHHPEHFKDGVRGMNLIDLIEMFCDWLAATKRHADGDIMKSIEINKGRFRYDDTTEQIFKNTAVHLGKGR